MSQHRKGPNKVGFLGLLQPFSDAIKLFSKNRAYPKFSLYSFYFYLSIYFLFIPLIISLIKVFFWGLTWFKTMLFILIIFSLNIYRTIVRGWASNSKYSLIGAIRRVVQTISYEVLFSTLILFSVLVCFSFYFILFIKLNNFRLLLFPFLPSFAFFVLTLMIELNRTPFDLSECESELVSGFNVEYGAIEFSIIFLGENLMIVLRATILSLIFVHYFIIIFLIFYFVWVRARFPRIRFDNIIWLCWVYLLPLILSVLWFLIILNY